MLGTGARFQASATNSYERSRSAGPWIIVVIISSSAPVRTRERFELGAHLRRVHRG